LGHHLLALPLLPGAPRTPLRENQTTTATIHFDDLETNLIPNHVRQTLATVFL
jgi:hypothetical protein